MSRKQIEKNRNHQGGILQLLNETSMIDTPNNVPDLGNVIIDNGDGLYLVKRGHTMKIFPASTENGLHLQEHPLALHETFEDGLYLKHGNVIKNADTVAVGEEKLPILQWIL